LPPSASPYRSLSHHRSTYNLGRQPDSHRFSGRHMTTARSTMNLAEMAKARRPAGAVDALRGEWRRPATPPIVVPPDIDYGNVSPDDVAAKKASMVDAF
ncbi:hypothetical protein KEM55_007082, partial [Ascosphaera atra]